MKKTFAITKSRRGKDSTEFGTLEELVKYFSYTLKAGHSWNHKINENPRTIKGLLNSLRSSVQETQGGCYDPDCYSIATDEEYAKAEAKAKL